MGLNRIIIIGASSGMGRRLTELFAAEGCRIGISGRRENLLQDIQQQFPQQVVYECFDVCGNENLQHLETLVHKTGGMDLLIISAGVGQPADELVWSFDKMMIDTNVNGFASIANWGYNYFVKQGSGHLAGISSIAANRGGSHAPAYNASKSFQSVYLEGLAIKAWKLKKPITITSIEPGFIDTGMSKAGDKKFWIVPVDKAVKQIMSGLRKKKRKIYISRRWSLIARVMRWSPFWFLRKLG